MIDGQSEPPVLQTDVLDDIAELRYANVVIFGYDSGKKIARLCFWLVFSSNAIVIDS